MTKTHIPRVIMRIELTRDSADRLDAFCERTGVTKVSTASRLIDWFAVQPEVVQTAIQNLYPSSIKADIAKIILKKMAANT